MKCLHCSITTFFQLKKEKKEKPFCFSSWLYTQQRLTSACTTCPMEDPGESHISQSDSNLSRATFHSWWGCENEFDKVSVSNIVASKLQLICFFQASFHFRKMYWSAQHTISSSKSSGETESFVSSCNHMSLLCQSAGHTRGVSLSLCKISQ